MTAVKKLHLTFSICAALTVLVLLFCAFYIPLSVNGNSKSDSEDYLTGWNDKNGEKVSLYQVFDKTTKSNTFTRMLDGSTLNSRCLCLITHNISFSVWLGEEKIYNYQPKLGGIYGKRYGEAVHTISLPSFSDRRQLRIEAVSLRFDGTSGCNEAYLEASREFMHDLAQREALKLALCVMTFFFGAMLFGVAVIEDKLRGKMLEAICLGAITLIVSAWIGSQTMIMRLISPNPALLRVMEYLALDLLPIPVLVFYSVNTKTQRNKAVISAILLSALNTILSIVLVCAGVIDYSDVLFITHALIAGGVVLISYLVIRAIVRREMSRTKTLYITSAMIILVASGFFDMIRYYIADSKDFTFITVIGLLVFAVILAIYEYKHIIEMQVKSGEAELMQALAMEDTLTGLGSRAAFVAYEKELLKRTEGKVLFVHFDVNFLKKVNDVYGHAEGDKHLKATASVLSASFGEHAKVFRVGGDEFFVILDGENCMSDYEQGIEKLALEQQDYNLTQPPVPLEIAHGMAEYDCSDHDPETAERLADSRMYEHKRQMKERSANA